MSPYFVRRVNKEIYDTNNKPFLLKGVGIGAWLLFEGYMLKSFGEIDRPSRFQKHLQRMTNKSYADAFFKKWYDTFFTEEDIILIKKEGFNSIRIAIDYQFLFEADSSTVELNAIQSHFDRLDLILTLCEKHQVYIILDMHAAPGGQTGTNIDNSVNDYPELFESERYQKQLCFIWGYIANRYKDKNIIAAYDLLNEPIPNWNNKLNDRLMPLYKDVIQAIRKYDTNHMITLEGLHWSTDWSIFTELPDENILLQFHKYWNNPDVESLSPYLTVREKLNVPIFMGEGGENNLEWYYAVFKLYDQLNISFNFWTYKKMNTHNSISSFREPEKWSQFLEGKLTKEESIVVLNALLQSISYANCRINYNVINQLLQKDNLIIPAYGFDYYGNGISYKSNHCNSSSFRKRDNIQILDIHNNVVEPNFKQYGGEDYSDSNQLYVYLQKDDYVVYSFKITKAVSSSQISVNASNNDYELYMNGTYIDLDKDIGNLTIGCYKLKLQATDNVVIKNIQLLIG